VLFSAVPEIPVVLEFKPEFRPRAEGISDSEGRVGGDATPSIHDLIKPGIGPAKMPGKLQLRDAERLEKLLEKHLPGMGRRSMFWQHNSLLMIVYNLDNRGIIAFPLEYDPPPNIDAQAPKIVEIS